MQDDAIIDPPTRAADPAWRQARARLALYLEALPEPDAARLLEQALAQAWAAHPPAPLPAAMAALQEILAQTPNPPPIAARPLRRGAMVPAPLDRSLLRFILHDIPAVLAVGAVNLLAGLRRRPRLLSVAAALAVAIGYQQIG